jgi:undecaprenyl-diphosphatase
MFMRGLKTFCLLIGFSLSCHLAAQSGEVRLLKQINGHHAPGWDKAMHDLSFSVYVLEPFPPVAISLHGYFSKDREMLWNGYKSALSLCTALALSTGLKYTVERVRPFNRYPGYIEGRDDPFTPSFPSGHTTAAFATATSLSLTYRKWYVAVPAFTYAAMTAYARMRLGVHYPTDVLGGIVLGTGSALLTWHVHKKLRERKKVLTNQP